MAYHIIAVLVIEGLMVIFWLATFAATAARRAKFRFDVPANTCIGDTCFGKRAVYILNNAGLNQFSATAGMGAIVW